MDFPLTMPGNVGPTSISWNLLGVSAIQASPFTMRQQVIVWPGEKLGVVIALPPMNRENGAPWTAFFAALNGQEGTFLLGPSPVESKPSGPLGFPETDATANGTTIISKGWYANTLALKPGHWVSIGGQLRKVLTEANTDNDGNATFEVWPRARNVQSGSLIEWLNPLGIFRLQDDAPQLTIGNSRFYEPLTFTAIEADA